MKCENLQVKVLKHGAYNRYFVNYTCSFQLFSRANLRFFFRVLQIISAFFSRQAVIFREKAPISPLRDGRNEETCERNPIVPTHPNERKSNSFEHHSKVAVDYKMRF